MVFEYTPIRLESRKPIQLGKHPISRNKLVDSLSNAGISLLERLVLGIKRADLEVYEITYQSPITTEHQENNAGIVRYYPASEKSAVIVLPNRASGFATPQKSSGLNAAQIVATYLAANGISAYEVETPFNCSRRAKVAVKMDLEMSKNTFNQAIVEVRSLIDNIKEKNIGIIGVSQGAMYASILYGIEERLTSACLIMGGGNLVDMIFESDDGCIASLKNYLIQSGIKKEKAREELRKIEPLNYAKPSKSRNLLMINAASDKVVPLKYGKQLREAWGYPEQIVINAGHFTVIKEVRTLLEKVLTHYRKTLCPFSL
ncbi:hypothetical protein J4480_01575 [Candidatus Woesearchaeota archaeon]|nr:hypothetical protein [Candidatus Woesearchaeota archaeon]